MPKSFAVRMLVGGGQVMFNRIPELKPIDVDVASYDEIILGSPIWNSKGVPAVNAFLKDADAANLRGLTMKKNLTFSPECVIFNIL